MLINATPFNDPFLVHPDVDLIAFSFPLSFSPPPSPPSLCRWRRPRLISNLLDGLVHSNFPSNVPDWSPQRESHLYTVHTRTRNNICSQKKFYFFRLLLAILYILPARWKEFHGSIVIVIERRWCIRVSWNKKMWYGIYYSRKMARVVFENILFRMYISGTINLKFCLWGYVHSCTCTLSCKM